MMSTKVQVFQHLRKNPLFDLHIFPTISNFYGDGLLPQTNDYFHIGFAWLWYNPEYHLVTYDDTIYEEITILIYHDMPVFDMGDGWMRMDDHSFNNLLDLDLLEDQ